MKLRSIITIGISLLCAMVFLTSCDQSKSHYTYTINQLKFSRDGDFLYSDHEFIRNNLFHRWLLKEIKKNKFKLYVDNDWDGNFTDKVSYEELMQSLTTIDTLMVVDAITLEEAFETIQNNPQLEYTYKFGLFQKWSFSEKNQSVQSRIDSIKIYEDMFDENGNYITMKTLCMIKFE